VSLLIAIFNLLRILLLGIFCTIFYPLLKNKSVYLFLYFSGPSFIKLGQALATRPDLVGQQLSNILANFQDKLKPFPNNKVRKIINNEFKNFNEIFIDFNYNAAASASIAQVHKAQLKNRDYVAVKILRPNIQKIVKRDIKTLEFIIKIVKFFSPFFSRSLNDINQVLKDTAKSELNLLKEASYALRLKNDLSHISGFYVPKIYLEYSCEKILVSEWIDGIPFSDKEMIRSSKFDKKEIAKNLVISYFTQVYSNGFFHADMHPGNLFLMKNGNIAVVDFGIMGEIDKKLRLSIAEIFIAFLNKDYKKVAQIHIDCGLVDKTVNVFDLALSCQKIGEKIVDVSVKEISLASLLTSLITMTHDYQMSTKPELLLLQKTLLLVEGVGVMIDEDLNIWDLARPWVKEWAKKNIGFDAKIRDALINFFENIKDIIKNN